VLLNLLSNAVRFTDHGGVSVQCVEHPNEIEIRVADTGIGVAPELHEQIFEPFVQADGGLTRRRGGTGLGLAISRELAHAMGGRVTVSSAPGRGSTFALVLPRVHSRPRPGEVRTHHAGSR
jgi:signal transduction histidine kinase